MGIELIVELAAIFAAFGLGRMSKDFDKVRWANRDGHIYYFDYDVDPNNMGQGWYRSID